MAQSFVTEKVRMNKASGFAGRLVVFFLLSVMTCKSNAVRIELREEVPRYERILVSLFRLNVSKENPRTFTVKGADLEKFLYIATRLPSIKSIAGREISDTGRPAGETSSVFIIYDKSLQPEVQNDFEIFFGFLEKKYLAALNAYSYTLRPPLDARFLLSILGHFPFVLHAEENRTLKSF